MGEMADDIADAYAYWGEEPWCFTSDYITCKYCGETELHWEKEKENGKWKLYDPDGYRHKCK